MSNLFKNNYFNFIVNSSSQIIILMASHTQFLFLSISTPSNNCLPRRMSVGGKMRTASLSNSSATLHGSLMLVQWNLGFVSRGSADGVVFLLVISGFHCRRLCVGRSEKGESEGIMSI